MNDDYSDAGFIVDYLEDLWWVFYMRQSVVPDLRHDLVEAFSCLGIHVVSEYVSAPFFQLLFRDTVNDSQFEVSNSSDELAPYLFLGVKVDLVLPPEDTTARLNADLFLEYGKLCYRVLRPRYAFAENPNLYIEMTDVDRACLTHICWANLFGPEYVQGIGQGVLSNAPGWRNENLGDGGILYVLAASPYLYRGPRQYWEEARQYFKRHTSKPIVWSDAPL
jgi:hypothetical protein